nr:MAG TPA: hypothetical protein [Caudoviricetes sp.]
MQGSYYSRPFLSTGNNLLKRSRLPPWVFLFLKTQFYNIFLSFPVMVFYAIFSASPFST